MKHWIAVISLSHAQIAADSGFLQVCHGKQGPLKHTSAGDEVFIYCPKTDMRSGDVLKQITFRGHIDNDDIYQVEQAPGFTPFRKSVTFDNAFQPVAIKAVQGLELTANPKWGMLARRGFFEISAHDAEVLGAHEGVLL